MRKKLMALLPLMVFAGLGALAQAKRPLFTGMYIQWGYNTESYSRSNIHFAMGNGDKFTLHNVKAHDKPDMNAVIKRPFDISIPQYNYRLGFYLNSKKSRAVEVNFDHIKYVVTGGQKVHVTGVLDGQPVNGDSILNASTFLHLEHTDGGNLLHINYVQQNNIAKTGGNGRDLLNFVWKLGAGINIPRTDFTFRGDRLNNNFHVAGYNISAEAGTRLYPFRYMFFEFTGKSGYVKYVNALANTQQLKGNSVKHNFGYLEWIGLIGFDIKF